MSGRRVFAATLASVAALVACVPTPPTPAPLVVIGHRGNPVDAPENTIAALHSAFAAGSDAVELDIRVTRDGTLVVMHDETVERTTNGQGAVAELTLTELKALDAGSWKDARFAGERVPTLVEALHAARGRGRLLLDVPVDGLGSAIAAVLRATNTPPGAVMLGSWDSAQRADFARHLPDVTLLLSEGAPASWDEAYFRQVKAAGVTIFEIPNATPAFIADAQARGMPVYAYTINDEPTMRQLIEGGVDGIETDDPALAVRVARTIGRRR